jgi:addiction module HigA family antidote
MKVKRKMLKSSTTIEGVPLGPALVTPGEILAEEFLRPLGLTQSQLADKMGVDRMRINEIVRGTRTITADTALRLAAVLDTTPQFWLGLQTDHDLAKAALGAKVATSKKRPRS